MSQDTIVTNFTAAVTTDAATFITDLAVYGKSLVDLIYEIDSLDAAHKDQIRSLDRSAILLLRARLERFNQTLAVVLRTPDV